MSEREEGQFCHFQFFTIIRRWIMLGTHPILHPTNVSSCNRCIIKIELEINLCESAKCKIECVHTIIDKF